MTVLTKLKTRTLTFVFVAQTDVAQGAALMQSLTKDIEDETRILTFINTLYQKFRTKHFNHFVQGHPHLSILFSKVNLVTTENRQGHPHLSILLSKVCPELASQSLALNRHQH